MSKALDLADEMAAYLETLPELSGIDVIVDRQKDIETEILKAVEKSKGAAVVILYVGGKNIHKDGKQFLYKKHKYSISVHCLSMIQTEDQMPADDIVETVELAMNGWKSPSNTKRCQDVVHVEGDELVPHESLLIYDVQMSLAAVLTNNNNE